MAYFKTLLSIVDWKHVLNENYPNNAYSEFIRTFLGLNNEAFPNQNIKIKWKSFNIPWMTKGLVNHQRRDKDCLKNLWKILILKRSWITNNIKHFSNIWKRNQIKTIIQMLYKYNIKKLWMPWKKQLEIKESPMSLPSILSLEKQRNTRQKRNCGNF